VRNVLTKNKMPAYTNKKGKISVAELSCGNCEIWLLVSLELRDHAFRCPKCEKLFLVNDIFEIKRVKEKNATS